MNAARKKPQDAEVVQLLRAIHHELVVARAPRVGAITVETAAGILGCSTRQVFREVKAGRIQRAPERAQVGRPTMLDAASVWRIHEVPVPRASRRRFKSTEAEAEAVDRIKLT